MYLDGHSWGSYYRDFLMPVHHECGLRHLAPAWQVEPDLEELQGIGLVRVDQREHLAVHDTLAGWWMDRIEEVRGE